MTKLKKVLIFIIKAYGGILLVFILGFLLLAIFFGFIFSEEPQYKIENGQVSYLVSKLEGDTFLVLNEADPHTFKNIYFDQRGVGGGLSYIYYADKNKVYYQEDDGVPIVTIKNADPKSFEVFKDHSIYSKDSNYVFFKGNIIPDADPNTFKYLESKLYKDKNNVYCVNEILHSADPDTFESISSDYFKDKNNVYYRCDLINGADADTISIIKAKLDFTDAVKDKNNVYVDRDIVIGADPDTFKVDYDSSGWFIGYSDKNHIYRYDLGKLISKDL